MSIWHKILVALIFLTIPFNFFFACRTLKTHQVWREKIISLEKQIAQVDNEIHDLNFGKIDEKTGEVTEKGIKHYTNELDVAMFQRGRAWFGADAQINTGTGAVVLDVLEPTPHQIQPGTILYCFSAVPAEEIDEKYKELGNASISDNYIGKFTVAQVDGSKIQVTPSMNMTKSESQGLHPNPHLTDKLKKSYAKWNLYEKMPGDEHALFLAMDEAQIRDLIPAGSVDEYLKDGKDDPEHPGTKYERKLRDYERIFDTISAQSSKLDDLIVAAEFDAAYASSALQDAKLLETSQESLKKQISEQLAQVRKERDAVVVHLKTLDSRCQLYTDKINKIRAENIQLARQIDQAQREAAKRIYERVQAKGIASTF